MPEQSDNVLKPEFDHGCDLNIISNYLEQCECCMFQNDRVGHFTNLAALYAYLVKYPLFLCRNAPLLQLIQARSLEIDDCVSELISDAIIDFDDGAMLVQNVKKIMALNTEIDF